MFISALSLSLTVVMDSEQCSICLEKYCSTVSVHDTDESDIKWFTKLQFIVPELEWLEEYVICNSCKKQLEEAWEFKKLVLNLETQRRLRLIRGELYPVENYDFKDDFDKEDYYAEEKEIACEDCSRTFTTQTQFRQHKLQIHCEENILTPNNGSEASCSNKIDDPLTCVNCGIDFITKDNLLRHIQNEHEEAKLCLICEKLCSNSNVLENHMRYEHGIKTYEDHICPECSQKFDSAIKLSEHARLCKKFECYVCKESYESKSVLIDHLKLGCTSKTEPSELIYQCSSCKNSYTTEKNLNLHKIWCGREMKQEITTDINVTYNCRTCTIKFDSIEEYNAHNSLKHNMQRKSTESQSKGKKNKGGCGLKTFSCEICGAQFGYVRLVVEHCGSEHAMEKKSVKPYLCEKCDMRFASSANLDQHRHYHSKNRTHVCSLCGKGFMTKSDLTVHEYTHYNRRNYKCTKCDKAFNTNKNLRTHNLVVHTDRSLWKYGCSICEKRFAQKTNYDQHMRRHTGQKDHVCHICKKPFISKTELRRHIHLHSNIKAFRCTNCDREYKEHRTYKAHLAKIHGIGNAKIPIREKKFVCHICPSQFYDKQKLSKHLCGHSGVKPFPCYACEKKFTDKTYLKHHLKNAHNIVESLKEELE